MSINPAESDPLIRVIALLTILVGVLSIYLLVVFVAIAIHECGHWIMGKIVGFQFRSLLVVWFGVRKDKSGFRFFFVPPRNAMGFVAMDPPSMENFVSRYRLFVLGGPIATFVAQLIAVPIFVSYGSLKGRPLEEAAVFVALLCFVVLNGVFVVMSFVPMTTRGFDTDALILKNLAKKDGSAERFAVMVQLFRDAMSQVRPREWNAEYLNAALDPADGSLQEMRARYLRYLHFADRSEGANAWIELETASGIGQKLGKPAAPLLKFVDWERTFTAAWFMRDPVLASQFLSKGIEKDDLAEAARRRALAALALVDGRRGDALAHVAACRHVLRRLHKRYGSTATFENDLLGAIEAEASVD